MKHILLFGAGKSATVLIGYLKQLATEKQWQVTVADADAVSLQTKTGMHPLVKPVVLQLDDAAGRQALVETADVVISLMPPALHLLIARDCLEYGKHLLTASYITNELRALSAAVAGKQLLFLCEMGLDPGIDHMSALQLIHSIRQTGAAITSFQSHCGGLVAPESDNNPWHYKITWNPRNVVLAGKAGAVYKRDGIIVTLPYATLFAHCRPLQVPGLGTLACYPNRDALPYASLYRLEEAATFVRTTLRYPAFCTGWHQLVQMGLTEEEKTYATDGWSYRDFFRKHLLRKGTHHLLIDPLNPQDAASQTPAGKLLLQQLDYLGLYDDAPINLGLCSAAEVLLSAMERRLQLKPGDKDIVVMVHELEYHLNQERYRLTSSLVVKGENSQQTAMALTVGLPLGIAAKLLLENKIRLTGVYAPVVPEIYAPVMAALQQQGIRFNETVEQLPPA